ncbi:MAG: PD40 domain-containing protein [Anaerolineales bacterium]|nr:PD40 domain-containing protein [Anaerolineales bacterium]
MTRSKVSLAWLAVLALGVTACLPEGMRLPQNEFLPLLERKSGLIAYLGTDGNIYMVDQSGSSPRQVTTDARIAESGYRVYGVPTWTADGQHLAFAAYEGEGNANPTKNSLLTVERNGTTPVEAYSSPDYVIYYSWSPDGRRMGVLSETPGGQALALKLVPAEGGEPETLDTGSPLYWTWAPDSRSLLLHANGAAGRLAFLNLGEAVVESGLNAAPSAFKAPAYSPDGRQVLYATQTAASRSALVLADQDGSHAQTLQEFEPDQDVAFAWSPDGRRVAYLSTPQLAGPITVIDPAGRQDPLSIEEEAYGFFWSPDSRSLAYFATETLTPEDNPDLTEPITVWKLMVLDARSGAVRRLTRFQPTERFLQLLPFFDQYHQSLTIWSPDSQNLVVSAYGAPDQPGLFVVAASGHLEPRFIAEGLLGVWSWK